MVLLLSSWKCYETCSMRQSCKELPKTAAATVGEVVDYVQHSWLELQLQTYVCTLFACKQASLIVTIIQVELSQATSHSDKMCMLAHKTPPAFFEPWYTDWYSNNAWLNKACCMLVTKISIHTTFASSKPPLETYFTNFLDGVTHHNF